MYSEIPESEDKVDTATTATAEKTTIPSTESTTTQWQQVGQRIAGVLDNSPSYVTDFVKAYQRPLITLGLLLGVLVTLKLTLALLDEINDLPLVDPALDLIGLGYAIWFVNRYLLRASNRQELSEKINTLKAQFFGRDSQDS